jgi:hypothetical protein
VPDRIGRRAIEPTHVEQHLARIERDGFTPRLRELIGYGVYNGLIGHIDKQSPARLLDERASAKLAWDD